MSSAAQSIEELKKELARELVDAHVTVYPSTKCLLLDLIPIETLQSLIVEDHEGNPIIYSTHLANLDIPDMHLKRETIKLVAEFAMNTDPPILQDRESCIALKKMGIRIGIPLGQNRYRAIEPQTHYDTTGITPASDEERFADIFSAHLALEDPHRLPNDAHDHPALSAQDRSERKGWARNPAEEGGTCVFDKVRRGGH